jgi:DNA-directed RNA polymerase specialized sigma subunit
MNNPESLYQKLTETLLKPPTVTHIKEQKGEEQQPNYLTTLEWKNINNILNHNNSTPELRNKVKNIIYNCYEEWAFSMVSIIKQKHWEKCGPIQLDELKLYGYIGLRKAVINYDSTKYNIFTNYAVKYIYSEVFSGIYELTPIYASDGNYKYKNKQKVISRTVRKNKRNETHRQKVKQISSNNHNEPMRVLRKKMAVKIE